VPNPVPLLSSDILSITFVYIVVYTEDTMVAPVMSDMLANGSNGDNTKTKAHEEMQYLDLIRDIMDRGQVRVSLMKKHSALPNSDVR